MWRFWRSRGQISEAVRWYERAFALEGDSSATARARATFGRAVVDEARGETRDVRTRLEKAVELFRGTNDTRWLVLALTRLAGLYQQGGDVDRAQRMNDEAYALARKTDDARGAAVLRANQGYALMLENDNEGAAVFFGEALESYRLAGDVYGVAGCLENLAVLALRGGAPDVAAANIRESLQLSSSIGDALSLGHSLTVAAAAALARGDPVAGARICAVVEALQKAHGFELDQPERKVLDETIEEARCTLSEEFAPAWAAGAELDLDVAVEEARRALA
jgi:tetratricopeptide (TPR) repeat protein